MILTAQNVVFYLIERGLLHPASVVDGDLMVVEATSRNRNFKIVRHHQPGLFVKQVKSWDPPAVSTLQREAACYRLAQPNRPLAALHPLVPAFHLHDPARHVLVVELLPSGESLAEYHRRRGHFPVDVARHVGQALGHYHRQVRPLPPDDPQAATFPREVPWILSVHRMDLATLGGISGASTQVLGVLQRYADFHGLLDALRDEWQVDGLTHGDMKWENCIVYKQGDGLAFRIVDWEMADFGDTCWDVGAIFQSYLTFWIMSLPAPSPQGSPPLADLARYPIEVMQPAIRTFWQAYAAARGVPVRGPLLERSMKYAAARMIQTAYEYMYMSQQLSPQAIYQLQVSLNILKRPQEALRDLLGLREAG